MPKNDTITKDVVVEEVPASMEGEKGKEEASLNGEAADKVAEEVAGEEIVVVQDAVSILDYQKSSKEHTVFTEYLKVTPVPKGSECGFCHSPNHKVNIGVMEMETCSNCHTFVNDILSRSSAVPINVHQTFKEKVCSVCHDPHAGPYRYLLKDHPESYFEDTASITITIPELPSPQEKTGESEVSSQQGKEKDIQSEK
jgi:predicted CXXCH cytochrome family protein